MAVEKLDPEIVENNERHQAFIDGLSAAFGFLGGDAWLAREAERAKSASGDEPIDEDIDDDDLFFINRFTGLYIEGEAEEDGDESGDEDDGQKTSNKPKVQRRGGKKGKKGKKAKKAKDKKTSPDIPHIEDLPLESFRLIDDDAKEGYLITDFFIAMHDVFSQIMSLRGYNQHLWQCVAYQDLNSAVAATMGNVSISRIKQAQFDLEADFPGHGSFDILVNSVTRGNIENAGRQFHIDVYNVPYGADPNTVVPQRVDSVWMDGKEQFLINTYHDLLAFLDDFRKTRSGNPTKNMLKELDRWPVKLTPEISRNKEDRQRWRRAYTINWLYDLVNVYSSPAIQQRDEGYKLVPETEDWSYNGKYSHYRTIWGLCEYAGEITGLAMSKENANIRPRILPHHVFTLALIVDSWTISQGWTNHVFEGVVINKPARNFTARRDVDLFLDREVKHELRGSCHSISILSEMPERDVQTHGFPTTGDISHLTGLLEELRSGFVNWLGESKYMYHLNGVPPSRFTKTNSNGLWEFSPFLCGAGLVDALDLTFCFGMLLWNQQMEIVILVHLHNFLVQKGYLKRPVGVIGSIEEIWTEWLFKDGKLPTTNFLKAFKQACGMITDAAGRERPRPFRRQKREYNNNLVATLDPRLNGHIKQRSFLNILREAKWVPENIPDQDLHVSSTQGFIRLSRTKRVKDPKTGKMVIENTPLVKKYREAGVDVDTLTSSSGPFAKGFDFTKEIPQNLKDSITASTQAHYNKQFGERPDPKILATRKSNSQQSQADIEVLKLLQIDVISDICGKRPYSAANYLVLTINVLFYWFMIEDTTKAANCPEYFNAYENRSAKDARMKRILFTMQVLERQDDKTCRVLGEMFEKHRMGFIDATYWGDLLVDYEGWKNTMKVKDLVMPQCAMS